MTFPSGPNRSTESKVLAANRLSLIMQSERSCPKGSEPDRVHTFSAGASSMITSEPPDPAQPIAIMAAIINEILVFIFNEVFYMWFERHVYNLRIYNKCVSLRLIISSIAQFA